MLDNEPVALVIKVFLDSGGITHPSAEVRVNTVDVSDDVSVAALPVFYQIDIEYLI
jgi:hypothetical protein